MSQQPNTDKEDTSKAPSTSLTDQTYNGLLPLYRKWLGGLVTGRDFRSVQGHCTALSQMLISSRYVSKDYPYGLPGRKSIFHVTDDEDKKKKSDEEKDKDKKDKDEKDKKDKDKKGKDKKDKKDKDKDKKGKDNKDKDKKDKKGKDKKDKDKKDKKDKDKKGKDKGKDKDKKDKKNKEDKKQEKLAKEEQKALRKLEKEQPKPSKLSDKQITQNKMESVKEYILSRQHESISAFAPCMQLVKCPSGAAGEECVSLRAAATSQLNAERCWFRYLEQLNKCALDKKDCVRRLKSIEDSCMHEAVRAVRESRVILEKK